MLFYQTIELSDSALAGRFPKFDCRAFHKPTSSDTYTKPDEQAQPTDHTMNKISVFYVGDDRAMKNKLGKLTMELNWRLTVLSKADGKKMLIQEVDVWLIELEEGQKQDRFVEQILLEQAGKKILLAPTDDKEQYFFYRNILPVGYLVHPFSSLQLRSLIEMSIFCSDSEQKVRRIMQNWRDEEELRSAFYIKHNNKLLKVKQQDILAIMADGNYCVIITSQRRHAVKISLRRIKMKLSGLLFRQIHRNYIVQIPKIESVDLSSGEVSLCGENYPIGGSFRQDLMDSLERI
jgi:hypothetical protein